MSLRDFFVHGDIACAVSYAIVTMGLGIGSCFLFGWVTDEACIAQAIIIPCFVLLPLSIVNTPEFVAWVDNRHNKKKKDRLFRAWAETYGVALPTGKEGTG